jgi:hypothetical protein
VLCHTNRATRLAPIRLTRRTAAVNLKAKECMIISPED